LQEKAGFEWHQFAALRYLNHSNAQGAVEEVEAGRLLVMAQLAHASLESCASIYTPLTRLQALQVSVPHTPAGGYPCAKNP